MKVMVTLDYYDGSKGKSKIVDVESITSTSILLSLMDSGACGMSITKYEKLDKIVTKMKD